MIYLRMGRFDLGYNTSWDRDSNLMGSRLGPSVLASISLLGQRLAGAKATILVLRGKS